MSLGQIIYTIAEPLTHVPVNIWLPLMFITAPVLVFLGKPTQDWRWLVGRLLLAWVLTYCFINLSLDTSRQMIWTAYQSCQSQFPDGLIQHHSECGEINIADGLSSLFYLYLGWMPALAYLAIWELVWRIRNRRELQYGTFSVAYKWVSAFIMTIGLPITGLILWMVVPIIFRVLRHLIFSGP